MEGYGKGVEEFSGKGNEREGRMREYLRREGIRIGRGVIRRTKTNDCTAEPRLMMILFDLANESSESVCRGFRVFW